MSADLTLAAIKRHGWRAVLLATCSKEPRRGEPWAVTADPGRVAAHLTAGGNLGLLCGPESGVGALDFDDDTAAREMFAELGPLVVTVSTGSGKQHCYFAHEPGLRAKLWWGGRKVGEVQRGPNQYVVMPPSVHPDTGRPYVWAADPLASIPPLPVAWREHLAAGPASDAFGPKPNFLTGGSDGVPEPEPWVGPPAAELLRRAMQQPGASPRSSGSVKFQCPGCAAEGHDKHRDNAIVHPDGRWGCALDREHKSAIGAALGVVSALPALQGLRGL
ncbi:MAG TPA: bifunctional DNA primase/polymerase [Candidatus Dormibacteraeota bacterium]|nr:bifunctional DNA primase/polymerase [Candidatus Dormibacteraeota bacterium]